LRVTHSDVCAQPKNFRIEKHPEEIECTFDTFGALVKWVWDSDSGDIQDLKKVWLKEKLTTIALIGNAGPSPMGKIRGHERDELDKNRDCRCLDNYMVGGEYEDLSIGKHYLECQRTGASVRLSYDAIQMHYWSEGIINHFMDVIEKGGCMNRCDSQIKWPNITFYLQCGP